MRSTGQFSENLNLVLVREVSGDRLLARTGPGGFGLRVGRVVLVWVVGHVDRLSVEADAPLAGVVVRIVDGWRVERNDLLVGNCCEDILVLNVPILDLDLVLLAVVDVAVGFALAD